VVDTPAPVLVYDRIAVNRRNTRLLLAAFAALLGPFAYGLAQFLPDVYALAFPDATGAEIVSLATIAFMAFIFAVGFACVGNAVVSSFLLWRAGARRAGREKEPELFRTVENLCIGAGLPPPALYIVESTEPNAFSTGTDPDDASLVISRGLLHLLDERELSAVMAHELSHIGNHDTDFSTMLVALVETVRFPLMVVTGIARLICLLSHPEDEETGSDEVQQTIITVGLVVFLVVLDAGLANVFAFEWSLRATLAVAAPIYVLVLAPACATLLRRTMSQQRDFLADADAALLTRDPEGVALALAKVGGAIHVTPNADAATAHLYFVDPIARASWFDGAYRSHPPIDRRIALLARMGDGIPETELRDAAAAGENFRYNPPLVGNEHTVPGTRSRLAGTEFRLTDQNTPLYEKPDGWSDVVHQLASGTVVTFNERIGAFARVATGGTVGYISTGAGVARISPK
jgi:heat shock protein HtpX